MNFTLFQKSNAMAALNAAWQRIRRSTIESCITHRSQVMLASDLLRLRDQQMAQAVAQGLFGLPLKGAGSAWESRRWLNPASDAAIATTGANGVNFNCYDFFEVYLIGFYWTVAGTVTAMVMDFDLYPQLNAGGTVVDKLNGVNGVITSPSVASQAIGNILYKDIGDVVGPIKMNPGQSVRGNVTTTTTAGNGMPFVLGAPRAETFPNLGATAIKSN